MEKYRPVVVTSSTNFSGGRMMIVEEDTASMLKVFPGNKVGKREVLHAVWLDIQGQNLIRKITWVNRFELSPKDFTKKVLAALFFWESALSQVSYPSKNFIAYHYSVG
jgi:hypothetical protein